MIPALPCRSECESRKTVWDQCVADIHKDAAAKKDFDTQMLAVADTLALGVLAVWQTAFPTGSNGERSPFDFLECDTTGGGQELVANADSANAFFFGQVPFVADAFLIFRICQSMAVSTQSVLAGLPTWKLKICFPKNFRRTHTRLVLPSMYLVPSTTKSWRSHLPIALGDLSTPKIKITSNLASNLVPHLHSPKKSTR